MVRTVIFASPMDAGIGLGICMIFWLVVAGVFLFSGLIALSGSGRRAGAVASMLLGGACVLGVSLVTAFLWAGAPRSDSGQRSAHASAQAALRQTTALNITGSVVSPAIILLVIVTGALVRPHTGTDAETKEPEQGHA